MFLLPDLPYAYNALEPYIDEQTMRIHHDKHHAGYVAKLNAALEGKKHADSVLAVLKNLSDLPSDIQTAVKNNGGGHANHSLFWNIMGPNAGGRPSGPLATAIDQNFGSFEAFTEAFNTAAATRFGSGWAWLVLDDEKLAVMSTANQDNPILEGKTAILGLDVWEHAYYLLYQNRRPDYIKNFFAVIDWNKVGEQFNALL